MGSAPGAGEISGATTGLVVQYIRTTLGEPAIGDLLERAGSARTAEELCEPTTWSSLDEWNRLLDAAEEPARGRRRRPRMPCRTRGPGRGRASQRAIARAHPTPGTP